jgi:hypothetical protein
MTKNRIAITLAGLAILLGFVCGVEYQRGKISQPVSPSETETAQDSAQSAEALAQSDVSAQPADQNIDAQAPAGNASGANTADAVADLPTNTNSHSVQEQPAQPAKPAVLDTAALIKLLRQNIDLTDPTVGSHNIEAGKLAGEAYKDYWVAYQRNKGQGTLPGKLFISGQRFYMVSDTPSADGGCNYYYSKNGTYLISTCGSDNSSWYFRDKRPHYLQQAHSALELSGDES